MYGEMRLVRCKKVYVLNFSYPKGEGKAKSNLRTSAPNLMLVTQVMGNRNLGKQLHQAYSSAAVYRSRP